MEAKLNELSIRAMTLIGECATKNDVEAILHLSETATRVKSLQEQLVSIRRDMNSIEGYLGGFSEKPAAKAPVFPGVAESLYRSAAGGVRARAKKLQVTLDWARAGKSLDKEVIAENLSSSTMAKLLKRLSSVFGEAILERLHTFRVSRGLLVSPNPRHDYVNHATGTLYGHQEIPGTSYFVLTHSANSQKVSDLKEASRFLGLPFGLVTVVVVEK